MRKSYWKYHLYVYLYNIFVNYYLVTNDAFRTLHALAMSTKPPWSCQTSATLPTICVHGSRTLIKVTYGRNPTQLNNLYINGHQNYNYIFKWKYTFICVLTSVALIHNFILQSISMYTVNQCSWVSSSMHWVALFWPNTKIMQTEVCTSPNSTWWWRQLEINELGSQVGAVGGCDTRSVEGWSTTYRNRNNK